MPFAAWLALTVMLAAPEAGIWLPTTGQAGERAIDAVGGGQDGALYAVGGGTVFRLEPGAEWTRLGLYAPRLRVDADGDVDARGPFPAWLTQKVELAALDYLQFEGVLTDAGGGARVDRPRVVEALRSFSVEQAAEATSPYHVNAVAPAPRGVWISTGAGLFRATRDGITGPRADIAGPVNAVLSREGETLVGTDAGLFRIPAEAPAVQVRVGRVTSIAEADGLVVFLSDGHLWAGRTPEESYALQAPTDNPLALAGDSTGLYLATRLAVYRRQAGKWGLCAPIPVAPTRLSTGEGVLHAVTPEAVFLFSDNCTMVGAIPAPWPGGFAFTGVARLGGNVWASSSEGTFMLTPLDADTSLSMQMEGFQRAVEAIPPLDVLVLEALKIARLEEEGIDFGLRPLWARLLPRLDARLTLPASRKTTDEIGADARTIEVEKMKPSWQIMAYWRISFERLFGFSSVDLSDLIETEVATGDFGAEGELEGIDEVNDAATEDIIYDTDSAGYDGASLDADALEELELATLTTGRNEHLALARERSKVVKNVERVYQQRKHLLYRLWVQRSKDLQQRATLLLSVEELDARLAAMTGLPIRSTGPAQKENSK